MGHLMRGFVQVQLAQNKSAMESFERSWQLDHSATIAISNSLFSLLYRDDVTDEEYISIVNKWVSRLPQPQKIYQQWQGALTPDSDRRLKVGYLSGDLRSHPVAFFLEPILLNHNHNQFEIYCYDTMGVEDDVTQRLKASSDHWRTCNNLNDGALAEQIQKDGIDILVDLSGHTANNRMTMLMAKPAPIQMLYIGYPASSGLSQIDYLISNGAVSPPEYQKLYREKILRVDSSFWCFQPHPATPEVNSLPAIENGFITFGSFNNTPKLSDSTIRLWSQVLLAIPNAKLKLKALSFEDSWTCSYFQQKFVENGVGTERVIFERPTMRIEEFFQSYHTIDIAVDPIPYNGGTTTCEALWMGVLVITLAGHNFCSRMSHSLLHTIGHPEFSATTEIEYVEIAKNLASDISNLQSIRQNLRAKMMSSSLCNGALATPELENAYRRSWREFCK